MVCGPCTSLWGALLRCGSLVRLATWRSPRTAHHSVSGSKKAARHAPLFCVTVVRLTQLCQQGFCIRDFEFAALLDIELRHNTVFDQCRITL